MIGTAETQLFWDYEEELHTSMKEVHVALAEVQALGSTERRQEALRTAKKGLSKCEQSLKQLEIESQNVPPAAARHQGLSERLSTDRAAVVALRAELRHATHAVDTLMLTGDLPLNGPSAEQRSQVAAISGRITDASARVEASTRLALETEGIGLNILSDLSSQREVVLRTKDNIQVVDSNLEEARVSLTRIWRRAMQNRYTVYFLLGLISFAFLFILYRTLSSP